MINMGEFSLESRLYDISKDYDRIRASGINLWIFDFSVGIGRTVAEAEVAMKETKDRNKQDRTFSPIESTRDSLEMLRNRYENTKLIGVYSSDREYLPDVNLFDDLLKADVEDTLSFYAGLSPYERKLVWHETNKRCFDRNTTAYTSFGHYFFERLIADEKRLGFDFVDKEMREKLLAGIARAEDGADLQKFATFYDGNGVKAGNDQFGYDDTTRHINVGAAAMVHSSRGLELLSTFGRKHSEGDEFFQNDLACRSIGDAKDAVTRFLYNSSMNQLMLYEPQLREFYSK